MLKELLLSVKTNVTNKVKEVARIEAIRRSFRKHVERKMYVVHISLIKL
jgi:hypothetical protein